MQQLALTCLWHVYTVQELLSIWSYITTLKKEKARTALYITCLARVRAGGKDGAIPHMAPRGPPPFLSSSGTTNATRSVRPRHSDPQTLTADDGTSSGKGDPKGGVHHHNTGTPTHATIPREEEVHHASIVL